jgi:hypothetical protein
VEFRKGHKVQVEFYLTRESMGRVRAIYTVLEATETDKTGHQTVIASGKGVGSIRFQWFARDNWNYVRIGSKNYSISHRGWGD